MPYPTIFMDECGYTGEDLCNKEQPVFTLATLNCTEEQAKKLKENFFGNIRAKELKHLALSKRKSQQSMVIKFLSYIEKNPKIVKFALIHKKYAVVTKMVDTIVEELAHKDGYDLYREGANIAYSNLLYYMIPSIGGQSFFNQILSRFQELMRHRTSKTYEEFFRLFFERKLPSPLEETLSPFKKFHLDIGEEILDTPEHALELAMPSSINLMAQWRKELKQDMILIHDESSNMANKKHIWDTLVDPELPPSIVGYDSRKWAFPIGVRKTTFECSKTQAGLQLTDILAGAVARCAKSRLISASPKSWYEERLETVLIGGAFYFFSIWPTPDVTPKDLGTVGDDSESPINYVAKILRKRKT